MLRLEGLHASYGAVRALHGVSMDVEKGAMVALLGSNGAGKSTTLKVISGMVRPTSGALELDGKRLGGKTPNEMVRLGVAHVPEGRKVFKDLMVFENLHMGAYARSDAAGVKRDMEMVLELFPLLKGRIRHHGASLSGGEQQMLAIGRGLLARPRLMMLDEPSLGLSPLLVQELFLLLRKLNRDGLALLLVEQNTTMALAVAARAYVMELGRVVTHGAPRELLADDRLRAAYLGGNRRAARGAVAGRHP
jgi:branched-chain amino acid transport system ATP-binding protein